MSIEFTEKAKGDVIILYLEGEMYNNEGEEFLRAVKNIIMSGCRKLVIDFLKIEHMNTDGLGKLLTARDYITRQGAKFKISSIEIKVEKVLKASKVIKFFDCYETSQQAVQSFSESDKEEE